jgi:glucose 1-dehydrogenase
MGSTLHACPDRDAQESQFFWARKHWAAADFRRAVLVRMLDLGICGTDIEIIKGNYGWAPPGTDRLIIGHESLGVVERAPSGCGFARGNFVAGIVRGPDPTPCSACAVGEWDMCRNGRFSSNCLQRTE